MYHHIWDPNNTPAETDVANDCFQTVLVDCRVDDQDSLKESMKPYWITSNIEAVMILDDDRLFTPHPLQRSTTGAEIKGLPINRFNGTNSIKITNRQLLQYVQNIFLRTGGNWTCSKLKTFQCSTKLTPQKATRSTSNCRENAAAWSYQ